MITFFGLKYAVSYKLIRQRLSSNKKVRKNEIQESFCDQLKTGANSALAVIRFLSLFLKAPSSLNKWSDTPSTST